ncbi:MAG: ATP-binding cassette domain-containing protein [Ruminococcus sp.]|nr:ATP-binding cassette domain-containing protein [Ruminococcus sp.]
MKLEVIDISKSFGEKQVLNGINFTVSSGEALGLLGRNGAGKTTTIRIIMQLFPPNSGEVLLDGKPIDIRSTNIGYMPEERGLYPKKKVLEQLVYFAELKGSSRAEAVARADKLLARLDMMEYRGVKLETLSKGNQQKIQLIATLMCDPDIVILDEPFSGLDPVNAMLLKDVVRECIDEGKIVIFSSHQMNYIEEFCNHIVIINDGQIAVSGAITDIKHSYTKNKASVFAENKEAVADLKKLIGGFGFVNETEEIADENTAGVIVTLGDGGISDLMKALADAGAPVRGVTAYEPSLAEIFVDYTEAES